MKRSVRSAVAACLALAVVTAAGAQAQAMPVQQFDPAVKSTGNIEQVWWRGGWGWRRPYFGYGYGWRRPFYGYGYGWRRPFFAYGYGWRRPYGGWRGW